MPMLMGSMSFFSKWWLRSFFSVLAWEAMPKTALMCAFSGVLYTAHTQSPTMFTSLTF